MPFNLLLLPLIGGYIFIHKWYRVKYYALRVDGHRLLFYAATAGAVFLFLSCFIIAFFESSQLLLSVNDIWHKIIPLENSGRAALAFLISVSIWKFLNIFFDYELEVQRVILDKRDPLEIMLRRALGEKKLVLFTVKNGKIYIGRIISNFNPAFPLEHITILPCMSGFRDTSTKKINITNYYTDIYEATKQAIIERSAGEEREISNSLIQSAIKKELSSKGFEIVIPRSEIQSASYFDEESYKEYLAPKYSSAARAGW